MEPSHRWTEELDELRLELHAGSEAAVFTHAVAALRELLGAPQGGERADRRVEAEATDRGALLADWLAELVLLAEHDGFIGEDVRGLTVGEDTVSATLSGRVGEPSHRVKGVAYHGFELRRDRSGWLGVVVLDQ
jgi:SHS2 domain-containing protein